MAVPSKLWFQPLKLIALRQKARSCVRQTEGRNIGTGIGFSVLNKRTENIEVTLSLDQEYIFYQKNLTFSYKHIIRPNDEYENVNFGIDGYGFKRIKTSIQFEDEIIIREGIAFCNLAILKR